MISRTRRNASLTISDPIELCLDTPLSGVGESLDMFLIFIGSFFPRPNNNMERYSEDHVHQVAGRVIPISMLMELGVDEDHLHRCVQMICEHANLDERGAAALIAHAAADELEGGAISWDQLIKGAKNIFGAVAPVVRAIPEIKAAIRKQRSKEMKMPMHMPMEKMEAAGAGFSFSDFLKKASSAAKAVRKAAPVAISLAESLGHKKAADLARKGLKVSDQLGIGAGASLGGAVLGGAVLGGAYLGGARRIGLAYKKA